MNLMRWRQLLWRLHRPVAIGLGVLLALSLGADTVLAQAGECGGVELVTKNGVIRGLDAADYLSVEHNNSLSGKYKIKRLRSRDAENGRAQVSKEVCSRLDLERDLLGLWKLAAVVASSLFVISVAWGGVVLMIENTGVVQQGRARTILVSGIAGIMLVGVGMYLWQSMFTHSIGFFSLEIGEIRPFGGVSPYDY